MIWRFSGGSLTALKLRLIALERQTMTAYYAARDPRVRWPVRLLALGIVAYALSPIDLIPDFIPVAGLLDELVLIPMGVALVIRLTPDPVLVDARHQAESRIRRPVSLVAAGFVVLIWAWILWLFYHWFSG